MGISLKRRDFLKLLGGGIIGTVISPLPWKLLDDSSIWTQNWSWLASPKRGPVTYLHSHCTLCPSGCGTRVRRVGSQPIALMGSAGYPLGRHALCPIGLAGHHLPYHPARISKPRLQQRAGDSRWGREVEEISPEAAEAKLAGWVDEVRQTSAKGEVAILDLRPGRVLSRVYRNYLAQIGNGRYLSRVTLDPTSAALNSLTDGAAGEVGLDLEQTDLLLSFGAPVLDGWLAPGRSGNLRIGALAGANSKPPRLIQVETRSSRSALRADSWLRIRPGMETALALGLARVIVDEKLYNESFLKSHTPSFLADSDSGFRRLINSRTLSEVSALTGLSEDQIRQTARDFARAPRAIAIAGAMAGADLGREEGEAILGLNLLVGSIGRAGGYTLRNPLPVPDGFSDLERSDIGRSETITGESYAHDLVSVPDHSIGLLIVDSAGVGQAIPQGLLERKLTGPEARVVSLSPYLTRTAQMADLVIPAPAMMESAEEVPAPDSAAEASLAIAKALLPAPEGSTAPAELIARLGRSAGMTDLLGEGIEDYNGLLQSLIGALFGTGRGRVFDQESEEMVAMSEVGSPSHLWRLIDAGGCWIDDRNARELGEISFPGAVASDERRIAAAASGRIDEMDAGEDYPLIMMPFGTRNESSDGVLPPELAKLYRESELKAGAGKAIINPDTAAIYGLRSNKQAVVETAIGSRTVDIIFDSMVLPGVVHIAAGPVASSYGDLAPAPNECVLDICALSDSGDWKFSRARVREA